MLHPETNNTNSSREQEENKFTLIDSVVQFTFPDVCSDCSAVHVQGFVEGKKFENILLSFDGSGEYCICLKPLNNNTIFHNEKCNIISF